MRTLILFSFLLLLSPASQSKNLPGGEKILEIHLSPEGLISSGSETIPQDKLAQYIRDRLFKSWQGNGKIYTRIKLDGGEQLSQVSREGIIQEIKEGQRLALVAFCLEMYRTEFENLDVKKQEKFRRKFPVLFQETYS
jgi:hypothetical protein